MASQIQFITDCRMCRDGTLEPCILAGYRFESLVICSLEDEKIAEILPSGPWTHEKLVGLMPDLEAMLADQLELGVSAYLGDQFVGSTEV